MPKRFSSCPGDSIVLIVYCTAEIEKKHENFPICKLLVRLPRKCKSKNLKLHESLNLFCLATISSKISNKWFVFNIELDIVFRTLIDRNKLLKFRVDLSEPFRLLQHLFHGLFFFWREVKAMFIHFIPIYFNLFAFSEKVLSCWNYSVVDRLGAILEVDRNSPRIGHKQPSF